MVFRFSWEVFRALEKFGQFAHPDGILVHHGIFRNADSSKSAKANVARRVCFRSRSMARWRTVANRKAFGDATRAFSCAREIRTTDSCTMSSTSTSSENRLRSHDRTIGSWGNTCCRIHRDASEFIGVIDGKLDPRESNPRGIPEFSIRGRQRARGANWGSWTSLVRLKRGVFFEVFPGAKSGSACPEFRHGGEPPRSDQEIYPSSFGGCALQPARAEAAQKPKLAVNVTLRGSL